MRNVNLSTLIVVILCLTPLGSLWGQVDSTDREIERIEPARSIGAASRSPRYNGFWLGGVFGGYGYPGISGYGLQGYLSIQRDEHLFTGHASYVINDGEDITELAVLYGRATTWLEGHVSIAAGPGFSWVRYVNYSTNEVTDHGPLPGIAVEGRLGAGAVFLQPVFSGYAHFTSKGLLFGLGLGVGLGAAWEERD